MQPSVTSSSAIPSYQILLMFKWKYVFHTCWQYMGVSMNNSVWIKSRLFQGSFLVSPDSAACFSFWSGLGAQGTHSF